MDNFKVFISSTSLDLAPFRRELKNKLVELQQIPLDMVDWGSSPGDAVAVSEEYVRQCDIFVGVYASRYGYTPVEQGPSVTEREYELARELGKRCLCYMADDSLKLDAPEEEPWKLERLARFKRRVDGELVRSVFDSPADLREKVGDDLNRLLKGFPLGYVIGDVKRRWREADEVRRAQLVAALGEAAVTVPSPLEPVWGGFVARGGWHERVADDLNRMRVKIEALREDGVWSPGLDGLAQKAGGVDTSQDYALLAKAVQALAAEESFAAVHQVIDGLKRERKAEPGRTPRGGHLTGLINTAYDVVGALRSLKGKVETRRYSRILPVLGGMGSGKTHFLAALMGGERAAPEGAESDYLLLPLGRPAPGERLDDLILEGVRERTRMQWRSLEEFDRFLEDPAPHLKGDGRGPQTKLVVALDDFQKWLPGGEGGDGHLGELVRFVAGHTRLHSLHWLILLRDISYAEVAGPESLDPENQWFWEQFSYEEAEAGAAARVGVWLVLDRLNRNELTGLRLIEQALESRPEERAVILVKSDEDEHTLQEFCSPFVARIVIDLLGEYAAATIVDLNFIQFVERFWKKRSERLDTAPLGGHRVRAARMLELATELFARSLLKGETSPYFTDALDDITAFAAERRSELKDRGKAEAALNILLDGNLLKLAFPVEKLSLQFESFWEWNMARVLEGAAAAADPGAARAELESRLRAISSPQVREGVLIFLLLLLDRRAAAGESDPEAVKLLVRDALGPGAMPPSAVWFAGPKCSVTLQEALAEAARGRAHAFDGAHDLFAYMYFLADCRTEVLDAPARLKLLQPHLDAIARHHLADYYLYLVERAFFDAHDEPILEAMSYFEGCEVLGVTQPLAETTLDNVSGEEAEELHFVLAYLTKNFESIRADYERREKPEGERRYFFWEWLICVYCRYAVAQRGLAAYRLLVENGWYDPAPSGLGAPVALRLRQEANLALGYWYRRDANRYWKDQYVDLVNDLAARPGKIERETAFFFIRHTEPYERDKSVRVREVFRPALEKLFLDPDMQDIVEEYFLTFKDNLGDFEALNQRRPQAR